MPIIDFKTYEDNKDLPRLEFQTQRQKEAIERRRGTYDYRWARLSKDHKRKNPECVRCVQEWEDAEKSGQHYRRPSTLGNECDHIIAIEDGGAKYDRSNLQTLCSYHHHIKTQQDVQKRKQKASQ